MSATEYVGKRENVPWCVLKEEKELTTLRRWTYSAGRAKVTTTLSSTKVGKKL